MHYYIDLFENIVNQKVKTMEFAKEVNGLNLKEKDI